MTPGCPSISLNSGKSLCTFVYFSSPSMCVRVCVINHSYFWIHKVPEVQGALRGHTGCHAPGDHAHFPSTPSSEHKNWECVLTSSFWFKLLSSKGISSLLEASFRWTWFCFIWCNLSFSKLLVSLENCKWQEIAPVTSSWPSQSPFVTRLFKNESQD